MKEDEKMSFEDLQQPRQYSIDPSNIMIPLEHAPSCRYAYHSHVIMHPKIGLFIHRKILNMQLLRMVFLSISFY